MHACTDARTLDMLASAYAKEFVYYCLKEDIIEEGQELYKIDKNKEMLITFEGCLKDESYDITMKELFFDHNVLEEILPFLIRQ